MFASFLLLIVISISTVFTTAQEPPPFPTSPLLLTTPDQVQYRISTAKLTIDNATRTLVNEFVMVHGLGLDLGQADESLVRDVQLALDPLVAAQTNWEWSLILWPKIPGLVQQLVELLKRWPGVLLDRFVVDAIKNCTETIEPLRSDLEKLKKTTDELKNKSSNQESAFWIMDTQDELHQKLQPIESALKVFDTALVQYLSEVKNLWSKDRTPNSTHQEPVTKALSDVKMHVTNYAVRPQSITNVVLFFLLDKVFPILTTLLFCLLGVLGCVLGYCACALWNEELKLMEEPLKTQHY